MGLPIENGDFPYLCKRLPEGNDLMAGWRCTYPSEKYEFVNGKDDIPYIMEK